MDAALAKDKLSARELIERQRNRVVELDYPTGADDVLELAQLGRLRGVSVLFRTQEAILVESLRALHRGLGAEKDTWRARYLLCQFDLATIPADDVKLLWQRAADLGDVIVPFDTIRGLYTQWTH